MALECEGGVKPAGLNDGAAYAAKMGGAGGVDSASKHVDIFFGKINSEKWFKAINLLCKNVGRVCRNSSYWWRWFIGSNVVNLLTQTQKVLVVDEGLRLTLEFYRQHLAEYAIYIAK